MKGRIKSKRELEIFLQNLKGNDFYKINLEQYPTDPVIASELLNDAFLDGNINGKVVADLGSGNGIFSVGSAILGAKKVFAVESDPQVFKILIENSREFGVEALMMDVSKFDIKVDTVIMNSPFGAVIKHSDRKFLKKSVEIGSVIYSIHNLKSSDYVKKFYERYGHIMRIARSALVVPRIYEHHTRERGRIECVIFTVAVDTPLMEVSKRRNHN